MENIGSLQGLTHGDLVVYRQVRGCVCGCACVCVCEGEHLHNVLYSRINMHVCKQMFVAPCALFVRFMLLGELYSIVYMRLGRPE